MAKTIQRQRLDDLQKIRDRLELASGPKEKIALTKLLGMISSMIKG